MSRNIYCDPIAIGESNTLAWDLAREVVLHPGGKYSLVYLYGVSGVGKTQMLRVIEQELREGHAELNVLFTTADEMTDLLIQDLIQKTRGAFEERYRSVDVLLVDDIQYLVGKEVTQEMLVKLFDSFQIQGKQLVIASDRPACELVQLNQHLQRRLESTASAEILEPGPEVRRTIVGGSAAVWGWSCRRMSAAILRSRRTTHSRFSAWFDGWRCATRCGECRWTLTM